MTFKVDFQIIGAQKCGTTSLADMLRCHRQVVCCDKKEPHFFATCDNWRLELPNYEKLFKQRSDCIYFEASTTYTMFPLQNLEIWKDLYEYNPDLKLLYIVRPPLERIISAYMHLYERGYTDLPLEKAVFRTPSLLYVSRYHFQISPFVRLFGRNQVKILFLSDLKTEPQNTRAEICRFLDLDPTGFQDDIFRSNAAETARRLHVKWDQPNLFLRGLRKTTPALYRAITNNSKRQVQSRPRLPLKQQEIALDLLRDDTLKFAELAGRDLSHWLVPNVRQDA